MLAHVEAHQFAVRTDTHGYHLVDHPIEEHAHNERVTYYKTQRKQVHEEYNETLPSAREQSLADENTRQHRAHNATSAVCRKHVERIVKPAAVVAPVAGAVTNESG